jgi:DeoR family ulaG and ulaABCDEF operon transcriptional repressor
VLCPLDRITTVITDDKITDKAAAMLGAAGVEVIVAQSGAGHKEGGAGA